MAVVHFLLAVAASLCLTSTQSSALYNPYYQYLRYNHQPYYALPYTYGPAILPPYHPLPYFPQPYVQNQHPLSQYPPLNVLAEAPHNIKTKFTVVPLMAVMRENINFVPNDVQVMGFSRQRPVMTVKTENHQLVQCTPAVKVVLDKPVLLGSLESNIIFPSEIEILYESYRIPINVGVVLAPIPQDVYVSPETPFPVSEVYAVPVKPLIVDYVNHDKDVTINHDTQAVIVEEKLPPKNVTILDFPAFESEPQFQVDEEDEELVNRNPPIALIPAGIVQSTQPEAHVEPFTNSKESSVLTTLREEANRHRQRL